MNKLIYLSLIILIVVLFSCCKSLNLKASNEEVTAEKILGNPNYLAISYGGYKEKTRDIEPSISEIKEDMKILSAMGIKILRTYNVQLQEASNLMIAITELKKENSNFEMYVMLGAWIDCKNAWTNKVPDHDIESEQNKNEIARAVALANKYPEIVKIIAVGNEAMVKWAANYYVQPKVILKWVKHLQNLKKQKELSKDLWITSSDDFASWGGGDKSYQTKDLEDLIKAVDYVSMHTYPYHNTHYNPEFWQIKNSNVKLSDTETVNAAMIKAQEFAEKQYNDVATYVKSISPKKPIHIGETGWASISDGLYGNEGSRASDEYKQALYYKSMRTWTAKNKISCFFFEAFDEQWKDSKNESGSENHFGLINLKGEAKFAIWEFVNNKTFENLKRDGKAITKTYNGDDKKMMLEVKTPPSASIKK